MNNKVIKSIVESNLSHIDIKSNEIRLLLQDVRHKIIIIVEGDSDSKLYKKFFDHTQIVNVGTCTAIDKIIPKINRTNVIGIRDSDFLRVLGTSVDNRIFLTDYHDLEMMILNEEDVIASLNAEYNITINLDSVCNELNVLILLKFYNIKNNKEINFRMIRSSDYSLDLAGLILKLCVVDEVTESQVLQNFAIFEKFDIKHLANGHDICAIIGLKCTKSDSTIEQNIRLSYHLVHFKKTNLYENLENYFNINGLSNILKS